MQSKVPYGDAIGAEVKAVDRATICRNHSITDACLVADTLNSAPTDASL